jgi:valyl-tRNA synthetase
MEAVRSGAVKIHPERYARSYLDWLGEKRDWCISRQLWWGHRIPIWYSEDATEADLERALGGRADVAWRKAEAGGWLVCSETDLAPDAIGAGLTLTQDPDVLDTWFSSALWPHSTLGWPEQTPELTKYYPTSVLSTARDIITLWVARMVIFGQFNMGDVPFKDVFIHPVIQDGKGRRMSKSAGNGIDPVDIIDLYGADALRYTLASAATETQDLRMPVEKAKLPDGRAVNTSERFEQGRTFPNKFWNAARLTLMNLEGYEPGPLDIAALPVEDRWILSLLAKTAKAATADLEGFGFAEASRRLRDFTWNDFCDWYVESVKGRLRDPSARADAQRVLVAVLDGVCRLLHPFMPFVTEQVWQAMALSAPVRGLPRPEAAAESVCIAPWPEYPAAWDDAEAEQVVGLWQEVTKALRNLRAERGVPKETKVAPILIASGTTGDRLRLGEALIRGLAPAASLTVTASADRPADCAVAVLPEVEVVLPLEGLIDKEAEAARLKKELAEIDRQLNTHEAKLNNESFVNNAPAAVVEQVRAKVAELHARRAAVAALLASLLGEG